MKLGRFSGGVSGTEAGPKTVSGPSHPEGLRVLPSYEWTIFCLVVFLVLEGQALDLMRAVDLPGLVEHAADLEAQKRIPKDTRRPSGRNGPLRQVFLGGGRGNRQHFSDRLDPVLRTMSIDERHHHFDRRSSSDIAKKTR